jgi:hypothetical protein
MMVLHCDIIAHRLLSKFGVHIKELNAEKSIFTWAPINKESRIVRRFRICTASRPYCGYHIKAILTVIMAEKNIFI